MGNRVLQTVVLLKVKMRNSRARNAHSSQLTDVPDLERDMGHGHPTQTQQNLSKPTKFCLGYSKMEFFSTIDYSIFDIRWRIL
jgi:hypothetical protein